MVAYAAKRALAGLLTLSVISMLVYALFWFGPRSPVQEICDQQTNHRCTPQARERLEEQLGYTNAAHTEYVAWVKGLFVGRDITIGSQTVACEAPCLNLSYRTRAPVLEELRQRFPATASLALGAVAIAAVIGVSAGARAARHHGMLTDRVITSTTLLMTSVPYLPLALLASLYLSVTYEVFPTPGYTPLTRDPVSWAAGLVLPWLVLGLYHSTQYTRYSRAALVDTLDREYIRTAHAKGLSSRLVLRRHALRANLGPIVTIFGLDVAFLLAGAVFTEKVFDIDGIGKWALEATVAKDLPVVQATVLLGAALVICANIVVDVVHSVLDPRIRLH